eukprot:scaffold10570_cov129-Isochrysis_galbana.AAC.1
MRHGGDRPGSKHGMQIHIHKARRPVHTGGDRYSYILKELIHDLLRLRAFTPGRELFIGAECAVHTWKAGRAR